MQVFIRTTVLIAYLANDEHDWPLTTANTPHIVKASNTMLHGQKQLGTLQGSTGGERERERIIYSLIQ